MRTLFTCIISYTLLTATLQAQNYTWAEHVAPILYSKCTSCHNPTGVAPFSLIPYLEAYNNRPTIEYMVSNRLMPPWPPDANYRHFAKERLLTQSEINTIVDWVQQGAPQGDPNLAPTPPVYNQGGEMINPDFSAKIPDYTVNTTTDLYRCFVLPTNFGNAKYITELELIPGNRSIVHHVLIFKDDSNVPTTLDNNDPGPGYTNYGGTGSSNSKLIGAWVPGQGIYKFPQGMGVKLNAGTKIILQIHYPGGVSNEVDSTRVKFKLTNTTLREVNFEPPLNHYSTLSNGPLFIPANETRTFTAQYTLPATVSALSVAPHMHLIGKRIKAWAITPTNDTIPLINVPNWQFNWQGAYNFRTILKIPAGTKLYAEAAYDNTISNWSNPNNPPQNVSVGEGTADEMMLIYFAYTLYQNGDENIIIDSSEVVTVGIENEGAPLIANSAQLYDPSPNPATQFINTNFYIPKTGEVNLKIIDLNGRIWIHPLKKQVVTSGINFLTVPIHDLPEGTYFIILEYDQKSKSKIFIKM